MSEDILGFITHSTKFGGAAKPDPPHKPTGKEEYHLLNNLLFGLDIATGNALRVATGDILETTLILSGTGARHVELANECRKRWPELPPTIYLDILGTPTSIYCEHKKDYVILANGLVIPRSQHRELRHIFSGEAMWQAMEAIHNFQPGDKLCCTGAELLRALGWKKRTSSCAFKADFKNRELIPIMPLKQTQEELEDEPMELWEEELEAKLKELDLLPKDEPPD